MRSRRPFFLPIILIALLFAILSGFVWVLSVEHVPPYTDELDVDLSCFTEDADSAHHD